MTPDEIAKRQQFSPESYLADLIREAVSDAYEDAARIAEGEWSEDVARCSCHRKIADAIRERMRDVCKGDL